MESPQTPRSSIRTYLLKSFGVAILIPSLVSAASGVWMIREQVFAQAQAQVTSDLEAAREVYQNTLDNVRNTLAAHSSRRILYRSLDGFDPSELPAEMERIRKAARLDMLSLTDREGRVVFRTRNPSLYEDSLAEDEVIGRVLAAREPEACSRILSEDFLRRESPELASQAAMDITETPRADPGGKTRETSGLALFGAAPVLTPEGRMVGVLYGGILLNRNYDFVDKVANLVFKKGTYEGRELGTSTIFLDDVRISTNVRTLDGSRAIATRVSAEVADAVLHKGETWRGRAFVVNAWYIAAYSPIKDLTGRVIGMLYVGTLEQPFLDNLWQSLYVFLGITALGMFLIGWVAFAVAHRLTRPIKALAEAARKVAEGDYSQKVQTRSRNEIGVLAHDFNRMTSELERAHQELKEWGENLERKVAERTAEVRAMQAHLIQAEKLAAIGKLAAGVAHEINNPLTGVLTNASLMLEDLPAGDPRREDLQTIVDETLRCRKIVKGLLDFARQTRPTKQATNLNDVVSDVLALVRNQATFRNIRIQTDLDPGLPAVMADRDQMRQVVLNIVLNASEAMKGDGELRIKSCVRPTDRSVVVSISDSGPGIPDDIKDKLFEPFFTTKSTGTGLGLAIAYGMVERHHGTLTVESAPGHGATLTLALPQDGGDG